MKKKHNFHMKSKHVLAIMIIVCTSLLVTTFAADFSSQPLREAAGYVVIPFEKGINKIGAWVNGFADNFRDVKKLAQENEQLQSQVTELREKNNQLAVGEQELLRLKELYQVDQEYDKYDKILAQVIAKEPGNWYNTFTIDKGTEDGIQVDMNVIAQGGLAGIVTEAGKSWATVRTIIDDGSNVSAMTVADSKVCLVSGNLELMDSGHIHFSQLKDDTGSVTAGENVVTSHISDKYLEGILIGTISSIQRDANDLTCTGYLVPAVDFGNMQEVLVITQLKENSGEDGDEK